MCGLKQSKLELFLLHRMEKWIFVLKQQFEISFFMFFFHVNSCICFNSAAEKHDHISEIIIVVCVLQFFLKC